MSVYRGYENRYYSDKTINFKMIKRGIVYLLSHSQYTEQITVGFYGGEPLLEMDLLKKSVECTKNVSAGRKIYFTLTNQLVGDKTLTVLKIGL